MAFDGSEMRTLLDKVVANGTLHGVAAIVVDRNGQLVHHAAGEANEHTVQGRYRNDGNESRFWRMLLGI